MLERFMARVEPDLNSGCWLWAGATGPNGYGAFSDDTGTVRAHRASWALHRGAIPAGRVVCHKCDVRLCVNPDHLWLGSQKENMTDARDKGRLAPQSGEQNNKARLTSEDVEAIRAMRGVVPQRVIAERFGVSRDHIKKIHQGKYWPAPNWPRVFCRADARGRFLECL